MRVFSARATCGRGRPDDDSAVPEVRSDRLRLSEPPPGARFFTRLNWARRDLLSLPPTPDYTLYVKADAPILCDGRDTMG